MKEQVGYHGQFGEHYRFGVYKQRFLDWIQNWFMSNRTIGIISSTKGKLFASLLLTRNLGLLIKSKLGADLRTSAYIITGLWPHTALKRFAAHLCALSEKFR